jgi:hypothetical protein
MSIQQIDVGDHVECDGCCKNFTKSDESGGILFTSKGYGPCCVARMEKTIAGCEEQRFIKGRCPPGMSFKDWILKIRNGDNTITILDGEDAEEFIR